MTATIDEVGLSVDLDQPVPCSHPDGCQQAATHRCRNIDGCHFLLCGKHAAEEHDDDDVWADWGCAICDGDLGEAFGRDVCRIEPL